MGHLIPAFQLGLTTVELKQQEKSKAFYNLGGCMPSPLAVKGLGLASKLSSSFW